MARTKTATVISLEGPFFEKDPVKTFRQNVRVLMDNTAELGEADVKAKLRQGEPRRLPMRGIQPERISGHVIGRTSNLAGKRWAVSAVVSVNKSGSSKRQGTTLMAAAATIERRDHVFRRTTARLRRARKLNQAELLKGLI